jgi:hypothetical protein
MAFALATNENGARDDLVAVGHADGAQRQVQAGRPGRDGRRVGDAEPAGERLLERGHPRAERELARAEHLEHELLLALAEDGPGERDDLCGRRRDRGHRRLGQRLGARHAGAPGDAAPAAASTARGCSA